LVLINVGGEARRPAADGFLRVENSDALNPVGNPLPVSVLHAGSIFFTDLAFHVLGQNVLDAARL